MLPTEYRFYREQLEGFLRGFLMGKVSPTVCGSALVDGKN
jgi:hypothetical protein